MLALTKEGRLFVWGNSDDGELGLGDLVNHGIPQLSPLENIAKIFSGGAHNFAITKVGKLYTWGWNRYGKLGVRDCNRRSTPILHSYNFPSEVVSLGCGWYHTLALLKDGSVFAWGDNSEGQLGIERDAEERYTSWPVKVEIRKGKERRVKVVEEEGGSPRGREKEAEAGGGGDSESEVHKFAWVHAFAPPYPRWVPLRGRIQ
jgi:alpha-tubulin suppressor-like RCC1 family protein